MNLVSAGLSRGLGAVSECVKCESWESCWWGGKQEWIVKDAAREVLGVKRQWFWHKDM